jgi:hypothetical protein
MGTRLFHVPQQIPTKQIAVTGQDSDGAFGMPWKVKHLRVALICRQIVSFIDGEIGAKSLKGSETGERRKHSEDDPANDSFEKGLRISIQGSISAFNRSGFARVGDYLCPILFAEIRTITNMVKVSMRNDDELQISRPTTRIFEFSIKVSTLVWKCRVDQNITGARLDEKTVYRTHIEANYSHGKLNRLDFLYHKFHLSVQVICLLKVLAVHQAGSA